jgi:hypothetical protein
MISQEHYEYIEKEKKRLFEYIKANYNSIIDKDKFIVLNEIKGYNLLEEFCYYPNLRELIRKLSKKEITVKSYYCTEEKLCKDIYNLSCNIQNDGWSEIDFYSYEEMVEMNTYFRYMILDKDILISQLASI